MTTRSDERAEFLATFLTTAIEGGVQYWADVDEYRWAYPDLGKSDGNRLEPGEQSYAFATLSDEDDEQHMADIETVAKGLRLVRDQPGLVPHETRKRLLEVDRTNGDEGDYDAADADAILQLGLFGEVVYG